MGVLVYPPKKAVLFPITSREKASAIFPQAKFKVFKGKEVAVLSHTDDATKVLRNLGAKLPAPVGLYYKWSGVYTPRDVQRITVEFFTMNNRCYCLNDMGSGKTISALWAFDYQRQVGVRRKALVVCPKSTTNVTWADEIFKHFPHLSYAVLQGTAAKRKALLAEDVDIYIVNHHGLHIIADELAKRPDIDLIIYDELAIVRNKETRMWKTANVVCNKQIGGRRSVWGMTGTPIPNAPTDAWGQVLLVTPGTVSKYRYFTRFKQDLMYQITQFKWKAKKDALDKVLAVMQPGIRFSLSECVELPEQFFIERELEMSTDQKKNYKTMMEKLVTEVANGEITAVNQAVKGGKLLQISSGFIYGEDKEVNLIDCKPRLEALEEVIEELEAKIIIFASHRAAIDLVTKHLTTCGHKCLNIHGGVSDNQRTQRFREFKNDPDARIMVADPRTMSHGLTLVEANTILWWSLSASNETFEQANARVRRPGQLRVTRIIALISSPAERKILDALKGRQSTQGTFLELIKQGVSDV